MTESSKNCQMSSMTLKMKVKSFLGSLCRCGFNVLVDDFGEEDIDAVRRSGRKNADVRRSGRKNADVNIVNIKEECTVMKSSKLTSFMTKLVLKRPRTAESNMVTLGWDSHSDSSYVYDDSLLQNYRNIASLNISGIGGSAIAVGMGDLANEG